MEDDICIKNTLFPIFKKKWDMQSCANYHGIKLKSLHGEAIRMSGWMHNQGCY